MPQVHTLRKIAPTIIALILLVAAADVSIFHRADIAQHFQAAVAIIPRGLFELAVALLTALMLLGLLIIFRRLAPSVGSFAHYLWAAPGSYDGLELKDRIAFENALRANRIQVITAAVQGLGGIAVLIGIYFAWANLKTTQKSQTETIRLTNEGQITDRFTKAIDQLGSSQLDVRLGGIYALERIARDSEKDHWSIMEVLTTYVREHAPVNTDGKPSGSGDTRARSNKALPLASLPAPSPDLQAILTVIGRRELKFEKGKEDEHLNLTQTNLQGADLDGAYLNGAYLNGTHLEGAHLEGALPFGAHLEGAHLKRAHLTGADLGRAHLNGADLDGADLNSAYLIGAQVSKAHLAFVDLTGATYAPASEPPDPYVAGIKGLATLNAASGEEIGLIQLRKLLQDAGL